MWCEDSNLESLDLRKAPPELRDLVGVVGWQVSRQLEARASERRGWGCLLQEQPCQKTTQER